jgi:SAM-dependent methyltransferase
VGETPDTAAGEAPDTAAGEAPDTARLEREASFHDEAFAGDARAAAGKYYTAARAAKAAYGEALHRGAGNRDVLEYGCGRGSAAFDLASAGDRVTGIDISTVGIDEARQRGEELGLSSSLRFERMDAERLDAPDAAFDLVCGSGILHHLDLDRALPEIRRVLRPGGRAVFFEPLGHNPLINLYRRLTPRMRTEDEHPLRMADVRTICDAFATARTGWFGLFSLAAAPLKPSAASPLLRALQGLDALVLGLPFLRRYAWIVVLDLTRD